MIENGKGVRAESASKKGNRCKVAFFVDWIMKVYQNVHVQFHKGDSKGCLVLIFAVGENEGI